MDKLTKIFNSIALISGETELEPVLTELAQMGKELVSADRCTVWLYDKQTDENWTLVAQGIEPIRVPARSGFVGVSIDQGEALLIEDAYQDPRFNPAIDQKTGYRTYSILTVPFQNSEGVYFGAFQAINKLPTGATFTSEDTQLIQLAATYAAKAIEARLLYNEVIRTQQEMMDIMGQIGESRSKETTQHVRRVALYSCELATLYGLSKKQRDLLRMASPMHDIGKVGIPDAILLKTGQLTDEEFQQMKEHANIGYEVFRHSERDLLQTAAIIAHQHHERWDGTGYPQGLKGEDIHIFGRITAIADVFDALGSERVYKKAWSDEKIKDYFETQAGLQFDPKLAELFLTHFDRFDAIRTAYADVEEDFTWEPFHIKKNN